MSNYSSPESLRSFRGVQGGQNIFGAEMAAYGISDILEMLHWGMQYFYMEMSYKYIGVIWYLRWNFIGKGNGRSFGRWGNMVLPIDKKYRVSEGNHMKFGCEGDVERSRKYGDIQRQENQRHDQAKKIFYKKN